MLGVGPGPSQCGRGPRRGAPRLAQECSAVRGSSLGAVARIPFGSDQRRGCPGKSLRPASQRGACMARGLRRCVGGRGAAEEELASPAALGGPPCPAANSAGREECWVAEGPPFGGTVGPGWGLAAPEAAREPASAKTRCRPLAATAAQTVFALSAPGVRGREDSRALLGVVPSRALTVWVFFSDPGGGARSRLARRYCQAHSHLNVRV